MVLAPESCRMDNFSSLSPKMDSVEITCPGSRMISVVLDRIEKEKLLMSQIKIMEKNISKKLNINMMACWIV